MKCAVTGSFDPITLGHLDLIRRARALYSEVTVLMLVNPDKDYTYTVDERMEMIRLAIEGLDGVTADYYEGWTVDYCNPRHITILVRGIRNAEDEIYERDLASQNAELGLRTVFVDADPALSELSSTKVRENIKNGIYEGLPSPVAQYLKSTKPRVK